jgi:hypothetical protein
MQIVHAGDLRWLDAPTHHEAVREPSSGSLEESRPVTNACVQDKGDLGT